MWMAVIFQIAPAGFDHIKVRRLARPLIDAGPNALFLSQLNLNIVRLFMRKCPIFNKPKITTRVGLTHFIIEGI
jgi:hypothetical protein